MKCDRYGKGLWIRVKGVRCGKDLWIWVNDVRVNVFIAEVENEGDE